MAELKLTTVNLSAPDVVTLARFYAQLLGYEIAVDEPGFALLRDPAGVGFGVAVQYEQNYVRPVWPSLPGEHDMSLHLEIWVDDLADGVAHALSCGATLAGHQPQDDVRVCLDPAGHPFCLWTDQP